MKAMGIYALVGILTILLVQYTSLHRQEALENTMELQTAILEEKKKETWELEETVQVQDDAIFIKDIIIDKQDSTIKKHVKSLIESHKEIEKKESEVKATREKIKALIKAEETKPTVEEKAVKSTEPPQDKPVAPKEEPIPEKAEPAVGNLKSNEEPVDAVGDVKEEPKPEPVEEPEEEPKPEEPKEEEPVVEPPKEEPPKEDPKPEPKPIGTDISVESTAYIAMCDTGCTGITATGYDVRNTILYEGIRIIAVDPDVIPLYTVVTLTMASGNSFNAIALDTGGAIQGNRIDLLVETTSEALAFGRQTVTVTIPN